MEHIFKIARWALGLLMLIGVYSIIVGPSGTPVEFSGHPSSHINPWIIGGILLLLFFIAPMLIALFSKREYSVSYMSPLLTRAEGDIMNFVSVPGDTSESLNQRYGELIGVIKTGEKVPDYYTALITKRVLYIYLKKFGDLKPHYSSFRTTVDDGIQPLPEFEKEIFRNFCISQEWPNGKPENAGQKVSPSVV